MPRVAFTVGTPVSAPLEEIFAYVSDLTRHGEWASDPVQIVPLSEGPIRVGSRYRSTAQSHGVTFHSELEVTECTPPTRFAFVGEDATGRVDHLFTFQSIDHGTLVKRRMQFDVNVVQWLAYLVVVYPVRIPSAKRTLQLLKDRLEGMNSSLRDKTQTSSGSAS
jgi:uncharacterized protein YndB with AHSA1/START domain